MKTLGIVAEYNPFHKGHKYLIDKLKKETGADYVVVIMSGDYVQRGCPAILRKDVRAHMALLEGADLVLELPIYYSSQSAEFFAKGAVSILDDLGCIDYLGFGSESGDIESMTMIADVLLSEPDDFKFSIKKHLKEGLSYASARAIAVSETLNTDALSAKNIDDKKDYISDILSSPNNVLAIEYLKALKWKNSSIVPVTTKRVGEGYDSLNISDEKNAFSSATAIRNIIEKGSVNSHIPAKEDADKLLQTVVPKSTLPLYYNEKITTLDDFSSLLHYRLLLEKSEGFNKYADVSEDLSDKIINNISSFESISDFTMKLKTKDLTYSRISRALLHILLGITKESSDRYTKENSFTGYGRILGLNKNASAMLKKMQENSTIPIISKLADAYKILDDNELSLLKETISASEIYNMVRGDTTISEYRSQIIVI
ncbi:MAG: nucleotidyltransferase [Butyrivibrio sp.]|nr:nucleotidyltransferase [Butyrivibrio sp.]